MRKNIIGYIASVLSIISAMLIFWGESYPTMTKMACIVFALVAIWTFYKDHQDKSTRIANVAGPHMQEGSLQPTQHGRNDISVTYSRPFKRKPNLVIEIAGGDCEYNLFDENEKGFKIRMGFHSYSGGGQNLKMLWKASGEILD